MPQLRKRISELNRLHALIRRASTGSPEQLASKFKVSKPTIIRFIQTLKLEFDAPIKYCHDRCCYYYMEDDFELDLDSI